MENEFKDFHEIHFDSIQVLRGVTSLFIVLEHIRFLSCGAFGVDIFFCLSGFMIMFSTHKSTKYFLRKRLIRILPLYYLMTLGTYLMLLVFPQMFVQSKADPVFLLKSLLFLPFDIGEGALQPLMRVGWTVNCEIFFYLIFLLSFRISHKYRGLICSALLCLVVGAAQLTQTSFAPLAFYGNPVMLEFIFGILAYYAARGLYGRHAAGKLPRLCGPFSLAGAAVIFFTLLATKPHVNILGFRRPLLWGLPALLIVLCFFIWGLYAKKMPDSLVRLGNISFSLYLVHYYPVMLLDRLVFDFSVFTPLALLGVAAAMAVSVLLACVSYSLIEKRFSDRLRGRLLNRRLS